MADRIEEDCEFEGILRDQLDPRQRTTKSNATAEICVRLALYSDITYMRSIYSISS